jgi:MFS family permease
MIELTSNHDDSEVPSNLVLKKVTPRIWLSILTFAWGTVAMCLGFIQNFAGFVTVRAILGLCEGGLLPGMVLHLNTSSCMVDYC